MKTASIILFFIIILGLFLRLYKLDTLMPFISDQGWFYLSARDLLINGKIPLVGITASYTWLHQGALWTYMLSLVLILFNFNPLGGAYLSGLFGVLTIIAIFFVGKEIFGSEKIGLVSALFFATSPLAIIHSRFPYHTSPLSLFTLIFIYSLYKYATGKVTYLILVAFSLGVLYNLELSTMVFWVVFLGIILFVRKLNLKIAVLSIFSFLIPMIPMIMFDISQRSGFFQTTAFLRFIKLSFESNSGIPFEYITNQLLMFNKNLIFIGSSNISLVFVIFSFLVFIWVIFKELRSKKYDHGHIILGLWISLSLFAIFINKDISGAYMPMVYPGIIILISYVFVWMVNNFPKVSVPIILIVGFIGFSNVILLISKDYNITKQKDIITYFEILKTSEDIVRLSSGKKYNLKVIGEEDKFENSGQNYEYLTWWMGHGPSGKEEKLRFYVTENSGQIFLEKNILE